MDNVNPLEQVKLDAERIMRERMESNKASKAWQESHDGPVSLDMTPVVAVEQPNATAEAEAAAEAPAKPEAKPAVKSKKGK